MVLAKHDEDFAEKEFMTFNNFQNMFAALFGEEPEEATKEDKDLNGIVNDILQENAKDSIKGTSVPVETED